VNLSQHPGQATLLAVLAGASPEQRAWLGGASGTASELDAADGAAAELFCRAMARAAATAACREVRECAVEYVRGAMGRGLRGAVAAHLAACDECAWTVEMLPTLADAVGAVAGVYAGTIVGPSERPATQLRHRVESVPSIAPSAGRGGRRRTLAGAAVVLTVVAGGATAATLAHGELPPEPPAVTSTDPGSVDDGDAPAATVPDPVDSPSDLPSDLPSGDAGVSPAADPPVPDPADDGQPHTGAGGEPHYATEGSGAANTGQYDSDPAGGGTPGSAGPSVHETQGSTGPPGGGGTPGGTDTPGPAAPAPTAPAPPAPPGGTPTPAPTVPAPTPTPAPTVPAPTEPPGGTETPGPTDPPGGAEPPGPTEPGGGEGDEPAGPPEDDATPATPGADQPDDATP